MPRIPGAYLSLISRIIRNKTPTQAFTPPGKQQNTVPVRENGCTNKDLRIVMGNFSVKS